MVTCTVQAQMPSLEGWCAHLHLYKEPFNSFKSSQGTRTLIQTLQVFTYSQLTDHNTFVHGATLSASRAMHKISLISQITDAYNNRSSIPIDELSFVFGILLTLQLDQSITILEAWLLLFQAGWKDLYNLLKQEQCNISTIKAFLTACTCGCHLDISPD